MWGTSSVWICEIRTRFLCRMFSPSFPNCAGFHALLQKRNPITLRKPLQNPHWMISKVHSDDNLKASRLLGPGNLQPMFAEISLSHFATRCMNAKLLAPTPSSGWAAAEANARTRPSAHPQRYLKPGSQLPERRNSHPHIGISAARLS